VNRSDPFEPVPTTPPPGPVSYGPRAFDQLAEDGGGRRWWLAVVLGLFAVGLGVWMLTNLIESVVVLAVVIAVSLITGGLVDAFVLPSPGRPRWAAWIEGLLLVAAGAVVLSWPDITLWVLTVTAGAGLLLGGLVQLAVALYHRHDPRWTLDLGLAAFGIALGLVVLAWPEATVVILALLFGIRAILVGALAVGAGLQMRRRHAVGVVGAAG
jgi:uncharacterized membrane protein HdeD (DUF308 family)